jgi:hypothetical protein
MCTAYQIKPQHIAMFIQNPKISRQNSFLSKTILQIIIEWKITKEKDS